MTRVGINQMRAFQLTLGVVNLETVRVQNFFGQRILFSRLKPSLVRVVHKLGVSQIFSPVGASVKVVVVQALYVFTQR